MGWTIAIGDMHGCSKAMRTLLEVVSPWRQDTIIKLGNYIDNLHDHAAVMAVLFAYFDQTWFRGAVEAAVRAYHACTADLADPVVGLSMGGVVIMSLPAS